MAHVAHYCYRINKKANLGKNVETGEPVSTLLKFTIEFDQEPTPEKLEKVETVIIQKQLGHFGVPKEWIERITKEEFALEEGE